jgi:hypothetical protein
MIPLRYRARMKRQDNSKGSITKTLLQDLMSRQQADTKQNPVVPVVENSPAKQPMQPALYQDAGNGYNSNFTFPQD